MKHYDFIILGAGASGLMTAYRMANDSYFDGTSILLIDRSKDKGNDRTWSFWEEGSGEWDDVVYKSWSYIYFGSEWFSDTIHATPYLYKTIRSQDFYNKIWTVLKSKPNIEFIEDDVLSFYDNADSVVIKTKHKEYKGKKLFNSIVDSEYLQQKKYPVLNQHFLGWFIKTETDCFDDTVATFMDFNIPQNGNTRFMYVLPFSKKEALFEYTLFSKDLLKKSEYEKEIQAYLKSKSIDNYTITEKEYGVIPMTSYKFHKHNTKNILNIGTAGGWTKASTGFTFMNTSKKTQSLISFLKDQSDLRKFHRSSKYWFYDLIFLDVLASDNSFGAKLFSSLFKKCSIHTVFRFLDETSSFKQDIKVISSVPPKRFVHAFFRRLFQGW
ncbi:lycopene cyclase family protein [Winogradskyella sp. A3E31]|uniref:lycopene cyclase family protein n=1 Tax=Winogradskyella sp. A3E31 TaxID=3349637 RepID=UPI00398B79B0